MPRISLVLVIFLLAGCASAAPSPVPFISPPADLACLGLHFVPVATTDPLAHAAISSEQAVSAAWQSDPSLKSATIQDLALGQLSNPPDGSLAITALAGSPLVWLVSFVGVQSVSSGPAGAPHHTSNIYAVVIDANTAQSLVAMPLCEPTSPP